MDKFLETYNLSRLSHKEIENLNRLISSKEIETIKKNKNKNPGPDSSTGEFYRTFKDLIPILFKLLQKIIEVRNLQTIFYKASITLIPKPDKDTTKKEKITGQYP